MFECRWIKSSKMKAIVLFSVILSVVYVVDCAGQCKLLKTSFLKIHRHLKKFILDYCAGGNFSPLYLKFGGHIRAFNVRGCYTASYVKSTCDISFHDSGATIASIPFRTRRKRQTYFGGSIGDIFSSLFNRGPPYNSGLTVPFNVNQYVNSLPRNSILYAIMTDGELDLKD